MKNRAEQRFENAVKKRRYRRIPPFGTAFDIIGAFYRLPKEYRPEDVLGPSYEALDPVRMDCESRPPKPKKADEQATPKPLPAKCARTNDYEE